MITVFHPSEWAQFTPAGARLFLDRTECEKAHPGSVVIETSYIGPQTEEFLVLPADEAPKVAPVVPFVAPPEPTVAEPLTPEVPFPAVRVVAPEPVVTPVPVIAVPVPAKKPKKVKANAKTSSETSSSS